MINIHEWLQQEKLRTHMILQVHDELVFDAHRDEIELLRTRVADIMKNAIPMAVQMETGIGTGENWLLAH